MLSGLRKNQNSTFSENPLTCSWQRLPSSWNDPGLLTGLLHSAVIANTVSNVIQGGSDCLLTSLSFPNPVTNFHSNSCWRQAPECSVVTQACLESLTSFYHHHVDIFVQDHHAREVQLPSIRLDFKFFCWIAQVSDPKDKMKIIIKYLWKTRTVIPALRGPRDRAQL